MAREVVAFFFFFTGLVFIIIMVVYLDIELGLLFFPGCS